jgi:hypothetical protein
MTAATQAPARRRPPLAAAVPLTAARLLRLELRRSAMPWVLPLIAVLFWFDSYRPSTVQPAIWGLRAFWNLGQGHTLIDFGPFVAAAAAWMASRDARRGIADLVTVTARPRWAVQLITWAATAAWAVAAYLAFVGVLFAVYAREHVLGTPPWWWVAVGAAGVLAFSAAGFAVGVLYPSRFAAPLAAFGGFLALVLSSQAGFRATSGWGLILPVNSNGNFQQVSGVFYPWLPDLPIARVMFLGGIAVAVLGLLGLPRRAGGPGLRLAAAAVTLAGVAAAGTAIGLVGTARVEPDGMVIPALHDAARDRPIAYTPVCGHAAGIPVCLNPAYRSFLRDLTGALRPVLAETAGLPGAPARVTQVAGRYSGDESEAAQLATLSGHPAALRVPLDTLGLPGAFGWSAAEFRDELQFLAAHAFVGGGAGPGTPAQQAVQATLLAGAGLPLAEQPGALRFGPNFWAQATGSAPVPAGGPAYAAAARLDALSPAARRAWLAAHLAALRSGALTLAQLP